MKTLRLNLVKQLGVLSLLAFLFVPNLVKLNHVLEDEPHVVCAGADESHFHEIDHDCDFKLKQHHNFVFKLAIFDSPIFKHVHGFVHQNQTLATFYPIRSYQLRAPPVSV